jgi:hypothetical protein
VRRFIGSFTGALVLVLVLSSTVAAATPAAMYTQFLSREMAAAAKVLVYASDFVDDTDVLNASGAAVHARQVVTLASREVAWLNSHKPARCYKNAWTYMRKGWTEYKKAYQAANRWLVAYPYGSSADFQTFVTYNAMGGASLEKAGYYVDLTSC